MSAIYYYEIIEVTKDSKKKTWIYEGRDKFSNSEGQFIDGNELVKVLMNLSAEGYRIKATTKDGVVSVFKNIDDFLTCL